MKDRARSRPARLRKLRLGCSGSTLARCLASGSRPRSSTSSSAISTATRRASSRPTTAAAAVDADLVAFPELAITGYPPEDLLLRPAFVAHAAESLAKIAARTGTTAAVVGYPEPLADGGLANSGALCAQGEVRGVYRKHLLPNYAVFDEQRYFLPSTIDGPLFTVAGLQVALTVCEDAWSATGPVVTQAAAGAEVVVNINASPYFAGRVHERAAMLAERALLAEAPIVYVNLVGGQDELVFDGASMVDRRRRHGARPGEAVRGGPARRRPRRAPRHHRRAPAGRQPSRRRCRRSRSRRATSVCRRARRGSSRSSTR